MQKSKFLIIERATKERIKKKKEKKKNEKELLALLYF